jgi:beta-lactamase regulating signal transducer with metallopeptidase domain
MSDTAAIHLMSRLVTASIEFLLLGFLVWGSLSLFRDITARWRRRIWLVAMFKPVATILTGFLPGFIPIPTVVSSRMLGDLLFPEISADGSVGLGPIEAVVFRTIAYLYLGVTFFMLVRIWRGMMSNSQLIDDSVEKGYLLKPSAIRRLDSTLRIPPEVRVIVTPEEHGPAALGVANSAIIVPESLLPWVNEHRDPTTAERRRFCQILRHELAHIMDHHNAAMLAAHVLLSFFWFHPVAHLAFRRLKINSEFCCDERVLEAGADPRDYARTLMNIVTGRLTNGPFALGFLGDVKPAAVLRFRLRHMLAEPHPAELRGRPIAAVATLVLVALAMPKLFAPAHSKATSQPFRMSDGSLAMLDEHGQTVILAGPEVGFLSDGAYLPESPGAGNAVLAGGRREPGTLGELATPAAPPSPKDTVLADAVTARGEAVAKPEDSEEPQDTADAGKGNRRSHGSDVPIGPLADPITPRSPLLPPPDVAPH